MSADRITSEWKNISTNAYMTFNAATRHWQKLSSLNRYKAQLVRLHAHKVETLMLYTTVHDKLDGHEPSLFQVLKIQKRREAQTVRQVITEHKDIFHTFVAHYKENTDP